MLSEPRTISQVIDLIHVPTVHSAERLREVYNEVCKTCGYENFLRTQGGARIERRNPDAGGFSRLDFLGDRIQLTEDHTGISVEQFGKRVRAVLAIALPTLKIPFLLVQQSTVRITSTPTKFRSASEFLARSVFQIRPGDLQRLERPTSVFGFRLVFPASRTHPESYNIRVESYLRDPKALYIENLGTFKSPIQTNRLEVVEDNLQKTSEFLASNVLSFLEIYDQRES